MPIRDDERRREYYRKYRAKRRAEQPPGERNRQDRDRRAAKRKAEREALPDPVLTDLWPHQQALYDVLESDTPPRLLTIRKGARVGLTTVQLLLADAAASRGEAVGVYAPTMSMARELGRLFAAEVAAPAKVAKSTVFAVEYECGGRVVFAWSVAKFFRLFTFDAAFGDEWASLPQDMQHEGSPGALLRGRVRSSSNPRVVVPASPSATGDALLAQEAEAGLHLEWMLSCPECGAWNSPRLDRITTTRGGEHAGRLPPTPISAGLACTGCGVESPQESWSTGRTGRPPASASRAVGCWMRTGNRWAGPRARRSWCAGPSRRTCPGRGTTHVRLRTP